MTFQELLYDLHGPDWIPPKKLLAIDPGETCGYAIFLFGEQFTVGADQCEWQKICDKITKVWKPNVVAYEEYRIYPSKLKTHSFSNVPTLKIIGGIDYVCSENGIKTIKILASTAKGFVSNKRLKEWGFYQVGKPHANDALRVGLHILLFSREL